MGLLDQLTGGSAGNRRQDYQDYTDRYDRGRPHEGYDDDEVSRRYTEVSGEVDHDTYRNSARQSFERPTSGATSAASSTNTPAARAMKPAAKTRAATTIHSG